MDISDWRHDIYIKMIYVFRSLKLKLVLLKIQISIKTPIISLNTPKIRVKRPELALAQKIIDTDIFLLFARFSVSDHDICLDLSNW